MMEQTIRRLRDERCAHRHFWITEGYKRGQEDAEGLAYPQLMGYGTDVAFGNCDERAWCYLPDNVRTTAEAFALGLDSDSPEFGIDKDAFSEGWFRAINEAWEQVVDKL